MASVSEGGHYHRGLEGEKQGAVMARMDQGPTGRLSDGPVHSCSTLGLRFRSLQGTIQRAEERGTQGRRPRGRAGLPGGESASAGEASRTHWHPHELSGHRWEGPGGGRVTSGPAVHRAAAFARHSPHCMRSCQRRKTLRDPQCREEGTASRGGYCSRTKWTVTGEVQGAPCNPHAGDRKREGQPQPQPASPGFLGHTGPWGASSGSVRTMAKEGAASLLREGPERRTPPSPSQQGAEPSGPRRSQQQAAWGRASGLILSSTSFLWTVCWGWDPVFPL
ncbi:PREDICTED: uncharacterized protein LOC106147306 [Chinchilla lanigera]|uniref:uncharacterized protein LOC106147306 n=1 Tax=Chinchilla lanigera TaxID=34839 RepID=UPI0006978580|nr:PREDICTED: uncharacterized protein LOC106147306 [Chinchilla lanigera]